MRVLCVLAILFFPTLAQAQEANLTKQQANKLRDVSAALETIKTLSDNQILTPERAELASKLYLDDAAKIVGHPVTANELPAILKEKESLWRQASGLFTFTNILWVVAGILLTVAICWLSGLYLVSILVSIPGPAYELLCYAGISLALTTGNMWLMFPASLSLIGCLYLTKFLHFVGHGSKMSLFNVGENEVAVKGFKFSYSNFVSLACTFVWGATAIYYGSELLGFMTVAALFSFLGFSVVLWPGCVGMGYEKDDYIPRTTAASFLILSGYVWYTIMAERLPMLATAYAVFGSGAIFVGTFVYYISLLIISSKYYMPISDRRYWSAQVLTIASGVAALYIGSVYDISLLQKVGGTLFFIYVLEKYYEIPWGRIGYAWSLLGISGGLYWLAGFAAKNPQYFILGWN